MSGYLAIIRRVCKSWRCDFSNHRIDRCRQLFRKSICCNTCLASSDRLFRRIRSQSNIFVSHLIYWANWIDFGQIATSRYVPPALLWYCEQRRVAGRHLIHTRTRNSRSLPLQPNLGCFTATISFAFLSIFGPLTFRQPEDHFLFWSIVNPGCLPTRFQISQYSHYFSR